MTSRGLRVCGSTYILEKEKKEKRNNRYNNFTIIHPHIGHLYFQACILKQKKGFNVKKYHF